MLVYQVFTVKADPVAVLHESVVIRRVKKMRRKQLIPLTKTISYKIVFQLKFWRMIIREKKHNHICRRLESRCNAALFCHSFKIFSLGLTVLNVCLRFILSRFICFKGISLFALYQKKKTFLPRFQYQLSIIRCKGEPNGETERTRFHSIRISYW